MLLLRMGFNAVIGGAHSPGSLCGLHCQSGLLPVLFSSRSHMLPLDPCSLPVNAVVGGVGMHSYSIFLVIIPYSLFVLGHSYLQSSLGLASVYLVAVLARDLVYHFLLLLFKHLLLHSHMQLFWGVLGLEDSFHPKGYTTFSNLSLRPRTWGCRVSSVAPLQVAAPDPSVCGSWIGSA